MGSVGSNFSSLANAFGHTGSYVEVIAVGGSMPAAGNIMSTHIGIAMDGTPTGRVGSATGVLDLVLGTGRLLPLTATVLTTGTPVATAYIIDNIQVTGVAGNAVITAGSSSETTATFVRLAGSVIASNTAQITVITPGAILSDNTTTQTVIARNAVFSATQGLIGTAVRPIRLDLTGGTLTADTLGDAWIAEIAGDMRVARVSSSSGNVWLDAERSILDGVDPLNPGAALGSTAAKVLGNNITLTARLGTIGVAGNDLEIDTSRSIAGELTSLSTLGSTYIVEKSGDLVLDTVRATGVGSNAFVGNSSGRILNGTPVGGINVIAEGTRLFAVGNIGDPSLYLMTQVNRVEGESTSGSVYVQNTGALGVGGVAATYGGRAVSGIGAGGSVLLVSDDPITVTETIGAAGLIRITTPDALSLAAGSALAAGTDIWLLGSSITADTALVVAGGSVTGTATTGAITLGPDTRVTATAGAITFAPGVGAALTIGPRTVLIAGTDIGLAAGSITSVDSTWTAGNTITGTSTTGDITLTRSVLTATSGDIGLSSAG
ncbi:MAG: hypothetical protein U1E26_09775, partial [Coriobacteriia bacterium]|nr:hypothetical protein [Coriobacteriia bacterium]